ncbi:MAG: hypothetical protein E7J78_07065, partial [Pantoea sp.]|nr:hypothetical protein [Pantoea sp.]
NAIANTAPHAGRAGEETSSATSVVRLMLLLRMQKKVSVIIVGSRKTIYDAYTVIFDNSSGIV